MHVCTQDEAEQKGIESLKRLIELYKLHGEDLYIPDEEALRQAYKQHHPDQDMMMMQLFGNDEKKEQIDMVKREKSANASASLAQAGFDAAEINLEYQTSCEERIKRARKEYDV